MKKRSYILTLTFLFAVCLGASAQAPNADDIGKALRGQRVSLECSKMLFEPNDGASLSLKLTVYPIVNQQTGEVEGNPWTIDLPDGSDPNVPAPYKDGVWKIVQGGGTLTKVDGTHYSYTSPAKAPKDNIMVISVDLTPTSNHWPKILLMQTLYFVNDQTAIVVNIPEGGFKNQKFVSQVNSGAKVPTMPSVDKRAAALIDPGTRAKMEQAQAAVAAAQQQTGINLAGISSNAMAYYDSTNDLTAMKFTGMSMQMENGRDVRRPGATGPGPYLFTCSFKGKGIGTHKLDDKAAGAAFVIIGAGAGGCFCGNNRNGEREQAPCNGYINIKSIEKGIIKGEVWSYAYVTDGRKIIKGFLHGKFTANSANTAIQ